MNEGTFESRTESDRYSVLTYVQNSYHVRVRWETRVQGRVSVLTANTQFAAVACDDGSVYIFSQSGRLLFPPFSLAPIAFLECNQRHHLMGLTVDGLMYVWNLTRVANDVSAQPLPHDFYNNENNNNNSNSNKITNVWISDAGQPVIVTGTRAFSYHLSLRVWVRIADETTISATISGGDGLLSKATNAVSQYSRPSVLSIISAPSGESIVGIETHLAAAQMLGSAGEYRYWLHAYVRRLTDDADITRLQELCGQLVGPPPSATSSSRSSWEPMVAGIAKRELLKEVIGIMAGNSSLLRMVTQFNELLSSVTKSNR